MPVKIKKSELWRAVREHCYECSGFSKKEARLCPANKCCLWPYRKGSAHAEELKQSAQPHYRNDPRNVRRIEKEEDDPVEQALKQKVGSEK